MTAPRAREQAGLTSPPERRPPRRGGGSSPSPYTCASAAGQPAGPPRAPVVRRGLARSAVLLALTAAVLLGGGEAHAQTDEEHWSATLTRAAQASYPDGSVSDSNFGYSEADTVEGFAIAAAGTLNPSTFTYGSVSYTVQRLYVSTSEDAIFQTSPALPNDAGLRLRLPTFLTTASGTCTAGGTEDFDLNTTSETEEGEDTWYEWYTSGSCLDADSWALNLSRTDTVKLIGPAATLSTDATLSALSVTGGGSELVTNFASDTTVYTASVANGVEEVTVTATKNHTGATITYLLGAGGTQVEIEDADEMEDGFQVPLVVGSNDIVVGVTAEDGTTLVDYVVTVTRAAAMTPTCTLNAGDLWCGVLTIGTALGGPGTTSYGYLPTFNAGSLSPSSFTHEGTEITFDRVAHNVYTISPTTLEVLLSPTLPRGYNFVLQAGSRSFSFAGGNTLYDLEPSGLDWSMSDGQTVTLRLRETPSEYATLSGLAVNDGSSDLTLSPAFAPDTTFYTAYALMAVDEVTVTPVTLNPNATIAWLDGSGMAIADADAAAGQQVALSAGENVIRMKVTAQDGTTMETYTVTVTRAAVGPPAAPAGFSATAGNRRVALAWTAPASDAVITHHEYRYKTDGAYPDTWKEIPYSAPGGVNEDGFSVTGLDNDTAHTFQLRAANGAEKSGAVESSAVTPSGHGRIVRSITIKRDDGQDGEPYGIGDKIVFVATFSQAVACVDDTNDPQVMFDLGTARKGADLITTAAVREFEYEYTVVEGDVDVDGIVIPAGPTALPNAYYAVTGCSGSFDKSGINAQGPLPNRKVDGVYPSLDSAVVNGTVLVLTWDETLRDDSVPAAGDFAVTVAGSARSVTGLVFADGAVSLVLASAVSAGETVTVSYTKGTNPLKDLASNDAPALTDEAVTNSTAPPDAPTNFTAAVGDTQVTLSWDKPESASGVTKHQLQFKTGDGAYGGWLDIANSGVGGETSYTETGLTNEVAHTFQLRAVNAAGDSDAVESDAVTPTPGICGRTQKVHEAIVYYLENSHSLERTCAEVTVADLATLTYVEATDQG